ncbi:probable serine/threonine-protein kinase drkD isoform X1 [Salvia splendens]|uniref:probable serine/threonine-protein kinase drkD isoform X1 n=1 Tax=Salvia splendens TaxID=180675 RepID=UPI001C258541|nr:probable serine/threonine-protein kinase drkD isoform X1 [Salvia splendens]
MDGGAKSSDRFLRALLDRFESLEASHEKLKEQFQVVVHEKAAERESPPDSGGSRRYPGWGDMPGAYFAESPYRRVLEYMGHALHVSRVGSDEIIYWNCAAEKLFGYKDYEVIGQGAVELLFDEEHHNLVLTIMERMRIGESWSGQLPLRKRSGQSFIALVTLSPLYEDGEIAGIVTVSSDAAVFNKTNSGNMRTRQDSANEQSKFPRINLKNISWHQRPQIAGMPHLASSVSNLASKVLSRTRGNVPSPSDAYRSARDGEEAEAESQDTRADRPPRAPITKGAFGLPVGRSRNDGSCFEMENTASELSQPSKIAVKILEKFQIGVSSNLERVVDERIQQNGLEDNSGRKEAANGTCSPIYSMQSASSAGNNAVDAMKETSDVAIRKETNMHRNPFFDNESPSGEAFSDAYQGYFEVQRHADQLPGTSFQTDGNKFVANPPNTKSLDAEDVDHEQLDPQKNPGSAESYGSGHGSSSSKGEIDLPLVGSSAIQWEDLQLKEEIGQGSFAVVYRGIWNGSDVAVKVYTGSQYDETLLDYKKEIDIMRRLRHPNVLLFMGASCTEEKIAIVTEYMTRGSLFKTLHRSNQSLDIRRRLRIALDVARGMNYLHHRNPPIVHRDLKSSNLLVDKSWNVKVGDFGLSKLKHSTFLTARSGRGTPQWMAPEVLRNELSTEKSDVYSFGVVLWELMTERIPWSDLNALQVVGVVGFMNSRLDIPSSIDPQIASIISECWTSNSEDRPSFKDMIPKLANLLVQASGGGLNRAGSQT